MKKIRDISKENIKNTEKIKELGKDILKILENQTSGLYSSNNSVNQYFFLIEWEWISVISNRSIYKIHTINIQVFKNS